MTPPEGFFAPAPPAATDTAALARSGRRWLKAGRAQEAITLLQPLAESRGAARELKEVLAEAYEMAGQKHRARLLWLEVARSATGGTDTRHLWRLGRQCFDRGDHAEAEAMLSAYLEAAPGDLAAAEKLLEARLAQAEPAARRAIYQRHAAEWPETAYALAVLAAEVARFEGRAAALTALARAEAAWQGSIPAALRIAAAHELLGQPKAGLAMVERALQGHPQESGLLKAKLRIQMALRRPKAELFATADLLVTLDPDKAGPHLQRARLCAWFKDWAGAAASWERARDLDRDEVEHWRGLLVALGNLERNSAIDATLAEARAHFRSMGPEGLVSLAILESCGGDHGRAAALAAGAMSSPRTKSRARDIAAASLLESGQYQRAWGYLSGALQDGTAAPETRRMAARCAAAMRNPGRGGGVPAYPDATFERALLDPPAGRSLIVPGEGVMLVTSSLGAGGAERQVALSAAGAARIRAKQGRGPTVLVGQDLSPERQRALMLPVATTPELTIEDLGPIDEMRLFREIAAADPGSWESLRIISGLPARISREVVKLYDCFRRHRPRCVHLWQDGVITAGSVAAVLAGVPRIIASTRNVVATEADRRRYRPYLASMYKALALRPEVSLTANSAAGAADYERWLGLAPGSIAVIRNGVELDALQRRGAPERRAEARAALGLGPEHLLMGGTFRLAPAKRPHLWLEVAAQVAARVPQARFMIVGDGVLRAELEAWISSKGLSDRIWLVGRKAPVEPWIAAMDVMLLASEVEGLPNVLLEAQALGVPVVTTNAGGSAEAVLDGITGVLVTEDRPPVLAEAVTRVLRDKTMRARAAIGAPAFIRQRFGMERMLSDTLAIYDRDTLERDSRA